MAYSFIGPIAILAMLRQYDYLIIYRELNYQQNLERLVDTEDFETLYQEYELIQLHKYEISLKFPNQLVFGIFILDIEFLKKEFLSTSETLISVIQTSNFSKFKTFQRFIKDLVFYLKKHRTKITLFISSCNNHQTQRSNLLT